MLDLLLFVLLLLLLLLLLLNSFSWYCCNDSCCSPSSPFSRRSVLLLFLLLMRLFLPCLILRIASLREVFFLLRFHTPSFVPDPKARNVFNFCQTKIERSGQSTDKEFFVSFIAFLLFAGNVAECCCLLLLTVYILMALYFIIICCH